MKNNLNVNKSILNRSVMVYKINCPMKDCDSSIYAMWGILKTLLIKKIPSHLYNGAPKDHMMEHHNMKISKKELEQDVKCIIIINDVKRLQIYEALVILKTKPSINQQIEEFQNTLGLFLNLYSDYCLLS